MLSCHSFKLKVNKNKFSKKKFQSINEKSVGISFKLQYKFVFRHVNRRK